MNDKVICVIGLGYVGLPLALEFSKKGFSVIGYDVNKLRVEELSLGIDRTDEVAPEDLPKLTGLSYVSDIRDAGNCNIYIVTVPTPIDTRRMPDLTPLLNASKDVGSVLKEGDVVIYESTVYPGATEDDCVPVLERTSGLKFNEDFYVGYSPERINPGDKSRPVNRIVKVTSGSTPEVAKEIDELYRNIIEVGTHLAPSIKVAEASKIIENTQRDVNIALINEVSIIFDKMDVDTHAVIDAASTKWNFVKLYPGLVGGHCIGVDPYYLLQKSISLGYVPDIIRSSREINDSMAKYYASSFIKGLISSDVSVKNSRVLVAGITFKENCPDVRNTKVVDLIRELREYGVVVDVYDPLADSLEVLNEFNLELSSKDAVFSTENQYDGVLVAVAHDVFRAELDSLVGTVKYLMDLKNLFK